MQWCELQAGELQNEFGAAIAERDAKLGWVTPHTRPSFASQARVEQSTNELAFQLRHAVIFTFAFVFVRGKKVQDDLAKLRNRRWIGFQARWVREGANEERRLIFNEQRGHLIPKASDSNWDRPVISKPSNNWGKRIINLSLPRD